MDWTVIEQKLESLRRAIRRVEDKCPDSIEALVNNYDAQDILTLNLTRAVQLCVDIGIHLIGALDFPPPDTMGKTFDVLSQAGIISFDLASRLKKAVGFRNIAVHNYEAVNWAIVFAVSREHLQDFEEFAKAVVSRHGQEQ